jgi:hypothetical protein
MLRSIPSNARRPQRRYGLNMKPQVKRSALESIGLGEAAGAALAAVLVIASELHIGHAFAPLHIFASVVLGARAMNGPTTIGQLFVGAFVNIALSGAFGFVFGALNGRLPVVAHLRWLRELVAGMAFGGLVYLFNFQLVGRLLYPWVLDQPQRPWALAHILVFGPVLAVGYVLAERREVRAHRVSLSPS